MQASLSNNDISALTHSMAEQSFLDWYYKFDGIRLGAQLTVNAISAVFDGLYRQSNQDDIANDDELRPQPCIVHFTKRQFDM
jgi:hypothetical protein